MPVRARDTQDQRVAGPNEGDGAAGRLIYIVPALAMDDRMTKCGGALDTSAATAAPCVSAVHRNATPDIG